MQIKTIVNVIDVDGMLNKMVLLNYEDKIHELTAKINSTRAFHSVIKFNNITKNEKKQRRALGHDFQDLTRLRLSPPKARTRIRGCATEEELK